MRVCVCVRTCVGMNILQTTHPIQTKPAGRTEGGGRSRIVDGGAVS